MEAFDVAAREWPRHLAEDPAFYAARNEQDRRMVAARLIPELGHSLNDRDAGPNRRYSRALRVVDEAVSLVRDEVLPRKLAELRANAHDFAVAISLDPDFTAATTKADRERFIRTWIEVQHGICDATLVRAVHDAWRDSGA